MDELTIERLRLLADALIIARRMVAQGETEYEEAKLRFLEVLKTVDPPEKDDYHFSVELEGEAYVIATSGAGVLITESTKI